EFEFTTVDFGVLWLESLPLAGDLHCCSADFALLRCSTFASVSPLLWCCCKPLLCFTRSGWDWEREKRVAGRGRSEWLGEIEGFQNFLIDLIDREAGKRRDT
ncbi:hypothetical protein Dimus_018009, partial [Dionaea muscipula]